MRRFKNKEKPKIVLLIPPICSINRPLLGIPALCGYLRSKGYKVCQRDINLDYFNYILSKKYLRALIYKLKTEARLFERGKELSKREKERLKAIEQLTKAESFLLERIKKLKVVFKDKRYYFNKSRYAQAQKTLATVLNIISLGISPAYFDLFQSKISFGKYSSNSSQDIWEIVRRPDINPLIEYYLRHTLPELKRQKPGIVGISISFEQQLIPALTLSRIIKENMRNCHVVVGGAMISALADKIKGNRLLLQLVDSFCVYEGELPLLMLAQAIERRKSLRSVPNLIYMKNNRIYDNGVCEPLRFNALPTPDFDGLQLKEYFSPEICIPYITSAGRCYWNKCKFCDAHKVHSKSYDFRDVKYLIKDIKTLIKKYKVRCFSLNDEAIPPGRVKELCAGLIKEKVKIFWSVSLRLEKGFDRELLTLMYRAGARLLLFGLESADQRILKIMDKGIDIGVAKRILRDCKAIGLGVIISTIIGFPGEEGKEARKTIKFLEEHKTLIEASNIGSFMLLDGSKVFEQKGDYVSKIIKNNTQEDLALSYTYEVRSGLSRDRAERIANEAEQKLGGLKAQGVQRIFLSKCR